MSSYYWMASEYVSDGNLVNCVELGSPRNHPFVAMVVVILVGLAMLMTEELLAVVLWMTTVLVYRMVVLQNIVGWEDYSAWGLQDLRKTCVVDQLMILNFDDVVQCMPSIAVWQAYWTAAVFGHLLHALLESLEPENLGAHCCTLLKRTDAVLVFP